MSLFPFAPHLLATHCESFIKSSDTVSFLTIVFYGLLQQVLKWQNKGLPQDNHSTENALIVKKTKRWPLFIDPQGQAVK